jgi:cell division protein FtsW
MAGATAGALSAVPRAAARQRLRWRVGIEARALVIVTGVLLAFGLATLYSASAFEAMQLGEPASYFLLRQLGGVAVGALAFALASKVDAERWRGHAWLIMAVALAGMLLTVLPFTESIAPPRHGARRYLLGGSVQPSEFAKLAVVVWTAMLAVKKGEEVRRLHRGLLPVLVVVGALVTMAALEPDLSVVLFFAFQAGVVLFAAGARVGHFVLLGLCAMPFLWTEIQRLEYVLLRLQGFADAAGAAHLSVNYQLKQSLIAVGSGGLLGVGFGEGRQQTGFLPLVYNDFIASSIGEEWGFVGLASLVAVFAVWGWLGFRIAKRARSPFQQLVAVGLTATTLITAWLHISVVVGLFPTTGLTLPFISYGRSNLVLSLFTTGILVNIGSVRERVHAPHATNPLAAGP